MPASAEGRVGHQKRNQEGPSFPYRSSNLVKLKRIAGVWYIGLWSFLSYLFQLNQLTSSVLTVNHLKVIRVSRYHSILMRIFFNVICGGGNSCQWSEKFILETLLTYYPVVLSTASFLSIEYFCKYQNFLISLFCWWMAVILAVVLSSELNKIFFGYNLLDGNHSYFLSLGSCGSLTMPASKYLIDVTLKYHFH